MTAFKICMLLVAAAHSLPSLDVADKTIAQNEEVALKEASVHQAAWYRYYDCKGEGCKSKFCYCNDGDEVDGEEEECRDCPDLAPPPPPPSCTANAWKRCYKTERRARRKKSPKCSSDCCNGHYEKMPGSFLGLKYRCASG